MVLGVLWCLECSGVFVAGVMVDAEFLYSSSDILHRVAPVSILDSFRKAPEHSVDTSMHVVVMALGLFGRKEMKALFYAIKLFGFWHSSKLFIN